MRRSRGRFVLNPLTNNLISTTGRLFRDLTNHATGPFHYFPDDNVLAPRPFIRVTSIIDPSDPTQVVEREHTEVATTPEQINAVVRLLEYGVFQPGLLQQQWWDQFAHTVVVSLGDEEAEYTADGAETLRTSTNINRIRADNPLKVPLRNVDMNPGTDDGCVSRWLGSAFTWPSGSPPTIQQIIERARTLGRSVEILDVYGGVMAATPFVLTDSVDRAVLFQGHVMPLERGDKIPDIIDSPVFRFKTAEEEDAIRMRFETESCAYWREDGVFKFPDGVWARERETEQWMTDFKRDFLPPAAHSWDMQMLREFLKGTSALYAYDDCVHVDSATDRDLNTGDRYVTIDVDKCYWRTAMALGIPQSQFYGAVPRPDPFIQSVPGHTVTVDELMHHTANAWYCLLPDSWGPYVHRLFGISTNLLSILEWREVYKLTYENRRVHPERVWKFEGVGWPADAIVEMQRFTDAQRKGFASIVGLCNDAIRVRTRELELPVEYATERMHYARMYGMVAYGNTPTIVGRKEELRPRNRAHFRIAVIHTANAFVLQWIRAIRDRHMLMPCKIKTDGLMYLSGAWKATAAEEGRSLDEYVRARMPGWKLETPNKPASTGRYTFQAVCHSDEVYPAYARKNIVYTGPPGTGKTYAAVHAGGYDFVTTMTNRNAVRLGGQTLYKLFRVVPGQEANAFRAFTCERFRDKCIFVDEAQQVPRLWYTLFMYLFHQFNTRFVFAMDVDQLAPVSNSEGPISRIPFHGRHVPLSVDHRNDEALQEARAAVLRGTFVPTAVLPGTFDPLDYTELNVSAHVNTRRYVNECIVKLRGLKFGDPGRYIVTAANATQRAKVRQLSMQQSQVLVVRPGRPMVFEDAEHPGTRYDLRHMATSTNLACIIEFGFCITAHSLIGSTIRDPMTIWDWDSAFANNTHGVLYTALTRACRLSDITFRNEPVHCREERRRTKRSRG